MLARTAQHAVQRWGAAASCSATRRGLAAAAADGPTSNQFPPPDPSRLGTADLCDVYHPEAVDVVSQPLVQIMQPLFKDLGGHLRFRGKAATVKCFEANPLVRAALEEPGEGRVLVVDGGASMRCALLGDNIAEMAHKNGWSGIIINGCIRDSEDISKMPLGVKALATYPLKSAKRDKGLRDVPVSFAGVTVRPGDWVYADKDGVIVAPEELTL
ncbi:hypothetical protein D9Q98_005788 [Chlorella vulgaris]|uniref:4-hydroxy-4-methyl-2-oxoglutarate aldolase n=1 Tax=Chlorella vulgaris TaxID=3077 RepID=A0A9D4TMR5_CHLVU|nr:hypothetical protein D9Q98_005788 [Chlorella vulgaris]